jgi:mannosyltransferase
VARFDPAATTPLRRPQTGPTGDLWDDMLRLARRVEHDTTQTFVRRITPWLVPMLLTGLIGAAGMAQPGLWTDELATWGMARAPWPEFWPVLRYVDAVLVPYYAFMHLWVRVFGDSDISLRIPSLLAMVLAAGMVGALGTKLSGRRAGLLAGTVFALLPSTSRFAAEARPYALTVPVAVAATALLVRAWEKPGFLRWTGYALAIALLGLLHVVALLLLAAHGWAVLTWQRRLWWRFGIAAACGAGFAVPLLYYGIRQRHQVAYIPPVTFYTFLPYGEVVFGTVAIAVFVMLLALFSLPLRFPSAVLTAWATVPPIALVVVSLAVPMFLPRYLLFTTPAWALLAGVALARLRLPWAVAGLLVIALLGVTTQLAIRMPGGHEHQATRQLAAVIASETRPGDGIVYADDEPIGSWTLRDSIAHYTPPSARPRDVLATHPPRTGGQLLATECEHVGPCLAGTTRLWVVRIGQLPDPLAGIGPAKEAVLRDQFELTRVWYPSGLTVALLERKPTTP